MKYHDNFHILSCLLFCTLGRLWEIKIDGHTKTAADAITYLGVINDRRLSFKKPRVYRLCNIRTTSGYRIISDKAAGVIAGTILSQYRGKMYETKIAKIKNAPISDINALLKDVLQRIDAISLQ